MTNLSPTAQTKYVRGGLEGDRASHGASCQEEPVASDWPAAMTLRMIDTFSGIGGFSLAARWLGGIETVAFVEREPFCQKILRKHWPSVPIHNDICTYEPELGSADIICGGFPCQDISTAGKQAGIKEGTRSGLFYELMRVVRLVGPRYIVLENVAAITSNGLDAVLGTLAEAGYDCEWACIPASALGACHQRDRWWCVAYRRSSADSLRIFSNGNGPKEAPDTAENEPRQRAESGRSDCVEAPHPSSPDQPRRAEGSGRRIRSEADAGRCWIPESGGQSDAAAADANNARQHLSSKRSANGYGQTVEQERFKSFAESARHDHSDAAYLPQLLSHGGTTGHLGQPAGQSVPKQGPQGRWQGGAVAYRLNPNWRSYLSEPVLRRGDDGLSGRVDRLKALGNAVVPQVAMIPLARVLALAASEEQP